MLRPLRTITADVIDSAERKGAIGRMLARAHCGGGDEKVDSFIALCVNLARGAVIFAVAHDRAIAGQSLARIVYRYAAGGAHGGGRSVFVASPRQPSANLAQHVLAEMTRQRWREFGPEVGPAEAMVRAAFIDETLPVFIDDMRGMNAWELFESGCSCKRFNGLGLMVVDGLECVGSDRGRCQEETLGRASRALRGIGKELEAPVLVVVEPRAEQRPRTMEYLANAGYCESLGDQLLCLD